MKTLNQEPFSNLPVAWTDEDWAKPLIVQRPAPCGTRSMKTWAGALGHRCSQGRRRRRGFTLIELLVVIAIIAILAALLFPVLAKVKLQAKIASAKADMNNIASAVSAYQAKYTVAPVPSPTAVGTSAKFPAPAVDKDYSFSETNTDVIVILMDVTRFANEGNRRNPEKHAFLNPGTLKESTTAQGVSLIDYNFRDPWGNPYIIAFDLDYDNAVEILDSPSGQNTTGNQFFNPYPYLRIPKGVLVWSMGPDGKAAPLADPQGYNKDNIKSWQ